MKHNDSSFCYLYFIIILSGYQAPVDPCVKRDVSIEKGDIDHEGSAYDRQTLVPLDEAEIYTTSRCLAGCSPTPGIWGWLWRRR